MSRTRLREVMQIQSETYHTELTEQFIKKRYKELSKGDEGNFNMVTDTYGNIYITKGTAETYPCVVAHTDTVHDIIKWFEVFEDDDSMFAMDMERVLQVGIGGDDKVGIYVALEMLREHDFIKVAFFRDEEHGCLGSREALMGWFTDVEFVLQCDRQGYTDFVNTIYGVKLFDKDFSEAIRPYLDKYKKKETDQGGLTDVYQLVENGLKVCVANISCGYHRPHCDDEIIIISEVFRTRDLVDEIIGNLSGTVWVNTEFKKPHPYDRYYGESADSIFYKETEKEVDTRHSHKYRTFDDLDDIDIHNLDLETVCSRCDSDEVMYDAAEDADWCFSCNAYTNIYSNYVVEDDLGIQGDESTIG